MKKIGFIAHDPGCANALNPLIQVMRKLHQVELYPLLPVAGDLWGYTGISPVSVDDLDLIVEGTIIPEYMTTTTRVGILDIYWLTDSNLRGRLVNPPDYLIVPLTTVKEKIIALDLMPADRIFAFGNPHFDRLKDYGNFPIRYDGNLAFHSQCSSAGEISDTSYLCKQALEIVKDNKHLFNSVTVTKHPREDSSWLTQFCNTHGFQLEESRTGFEVAIWADINVGVNSTVLYESAILNKPTVFYSNPASFIYTLKNISGAPKITTSIDFTATKKCVEFLHALLPRTVKLSRLEKPSILCD